MLVWFSQLLIAEFNSTSKTARKCLKSFKALTFQVKSEICPESIYIKLIIVLIADHAYMYIRKGTLMASAFL